MRLWPILTASVHSRSHEYALSDPSDMDSTCGTTARVGSCSRTKTKAVVSVVA